MNCENCYKKNNRLKGRRSCKGNLKKTIYVKVVKRWGFMCKYFIPNDYLFTWNENELL